MKTAPPDMEAKHKKIVLHKVKKLDAPSFGLSKEEAGLEMDRKIAEIIPSLADITLSPAAMLQSQELAKGIRLAHETQDDVIRAERKEMQTVLKMHIPHPLDSLVPNDPFVSKERAMPRKITLSPYQYEMINYQRMLLRKNIWYYRDRMNIPRGPCPLHVLKDAWVQGVIDENTLIWGQSLFDWLPAKNVKLLLPMIRTPEVRLGAWLKRTFSLKPALNQIRDQRKDARDASFYNLQVEKMR